MNFGDLFDLDLFDRMLGEGYIRVQHHPTEDLLIYNYSAQCQYAREWNEVTEQCRGLIIRPGGEVVARPFRKFFNYGEIIQVEEQRWSTETGEHPDSYPVEILDLDAPCQVTDKMDGSLGILYPTSDGWAIATRGSFTSDQAIWATGKLQSYIKDGFVPLPGLTYLFEIIYPSNRIVIDYGDKEDLFLLGVVVTETGDIGGPRDESLWPGPRTHTTDYVSLRAALEAPMRENAEGLVVRYLDSNHMLKIKQEDYVALHRIMTGMSAKNIWEVCAVQACKDYITKPSHWASYVGIGPDRAAEILEMKDDWLEAVPDEFYAWVEGMQQSLRDGFEREWDLAQMAVTFAQPMTDKRLRHEFLNQGPYAKQIIYLLDKGDDSMLRCKVWRHLEPEPTRPFAVNEDVA